MSLLPRHRRALRCESLERRNLLAAGLGLEHNFISPEDVDGSGDVTPYDALQIVNNLNRQSREALQGEVSSSVASGVMLDVDADGHSTPADAWRVINYLNQHGINGALAASLVPVQERIAALESALHSSSIPAWLGEGTAQEMLASLYSGLVPELNSDLQDELNDALHRFDLQSQFNRLADQLNSITSDLPSLDAVFSQLDLNLGSQYQELRNGLSSGLGDLYDEAESLLDRLFGQSHSDSNSHSDSDSDSDSTVNITTDNSDPTEEEFDVFGHIREGLIVVANDIASDISQLNFVGVLNTLENLVSVHLPLLTSNLPNLFDSTLIGISSDFSSELYDRLESVFDTVIPEVDDALEDVFGGLNVLGSAASQLGGLIHYLHGYDNYDNYQLPA